MNWGNCDVQRKPGDAKLDPLIEGCYLNLGPIDFSFLSDVHPPQHIGNLKRVSGPSPNDLTVLAERK